MKVKKVRKSGNKWGKVTTMFADAPLCKIIFYAWQPYGQHLDICCKAWLSEPFYDGNFNIWRYGQSLTTNRTHLRFSSGNNQKPCPSSGRSTSRPISSVWSRSAPVLLQPWLRQHFCLPIPHSPPCSRRVGCARWRYLWWICTVRRPFTLAHPQGAIVITENVQSSSRFQRVRGTTRVDEGGENWHRLHFPVVLTPSNTKRRTRRWGAVVEKHSSY